MELDNNMLTTLVERWRRETHTFHLLKGEAMITLKDITLITDLPINGEAIIGSLKKPLAGWGAFILAHLGIEVPTEEQVERYARVYLIGLVGRVLFPNKSNRYMHCMWLPLLLGDRDDMGRKSWGSACLATLYAELCKCTDPNTKQPGGAMFIVQLWA
ncbi:unnamed protein product [Linum trigynum]|uniref:Aminotransferase-like plant mobile domain-containing protein n=1 Tax=Linum trigynum TaxID=586398 RepID=A0AAV2EDP8_9ROSI